ncbi:MAG: hypothetical protein LBH72_00095 [Proteiniphilum sp.]|jgi:hypothetical protein|nr:hypothetical protein [Proteiniphilum sp.]
MKKTVIFIALIAICVNVMMTDCKAVPGSSLSLALDPPPRRVSVKTPCIEYVMDKPGEYMAGLGISSPKMNERDAMREANSAAIADIASRYIGVIKNGVQSYLNDKTVPSSQKLSADKLESIATSTGEKAIEKYAGRVCFETLEITDAGTYINYTVIHVPVKGVNQDIASELEAAKVDYDSEKFRQWMQKELDAATANNAKEGGTQ